MANQRENDEMSTEENKLDAVYAKISTEALAHILDIIDIDVVTDDTTLVTSASQAAAREVQNKIHAHLLARMEEFGNMWKEQGFEDDWKKVLSHAEALKTSFAAERAKEESKKKSNEKSEEKPSK